MLVAAEGGEVQRSEALLVLRIHGRSVGDERVESVQGLSSAATLAQIVERRLLLQELCRVRAGAALEEDAAAIGEDGRRRVGDRVVQRRPPCSVLLIDRGRSDEKHLGSRRVRRTEMKWRAAVAHLARRVCAILEEQLNERAIATPAR